MDRNPMSAKPSFYRVKTKLSEILQQNNDGKVMMLHSEPLNKRQRLALNAHAKIKSNQGFRLSSFKEEEKIFLSKWKNCKVSNCPYARNKCVKRTRQDTFGMNQLCDLCKCVSTNNVAPPRVNIAIIGS